MGMGVLGGDEMNGFWCGWVLGSLREWKVWAMIDMK